MLWIILLRVEEAKTLPISFAIVNSDNGIECESKFTSITVKSAKLWNSH